jgi:tetratricopeptide (TPR) repeat protein
MKKSLKAALLPAVLSCLFVVAAPAAVQSEPTQPRSGRGSRLPQTSMSDPAFRAADQGYKSYDRGDYAAAAALAQEAVRLSPSNREYRMLLVNALSAANRLAEADQAITEGIQQAGDSGALQAQREPIRRRMAEEPAKAAYKALEQRDTEGAIAHARTAVGYAPANRTYRMVLTYALLLGERFGEAEQAASELFAMNPADPSPLVLRAYARQRLGRRAEAVADLDPALHQEGMTPEAHRSIHLIAADAALAAKEPQRALDLLSGFSQSADEQMARRRRAARAALIRPVAAAAEAVTTAPFDPPALDCSKAEGEQQCALVPGAARDPALDLATVAYRDFARKDYQAAAAAAEQAVELSPDNRDFKVLLLNAQMNAEKYDQAEETATQALLHGDDAALLAQRGSVRRRLGKETLAREDFAAALRIGSLPPATEIRLLADLDRKPEARQRFDEALSSGGFAEVSDVEVAYLATRVGDDEDALAAFNRADASGTLPNTAYEDAAFAAVRAHHDAEALVYFKRSIAEANALELRVTPQRLFETRRAVAEVSRQRGVIASQTYRGPVSGLGVAPSADMLQAGIEGYWRPFGYRNTRYVELFARTFGSLYTRGSNDAFGDTLQTTVGIRHKLVSRANLVVSFGRMFSRAGGRNDWLAQLGYSGGKGTDLRVDTQRWWTTRLYTEGGRYLEAKQTYALTHGEVGRSRLMGGRDGRWVLFPHVSAAADYDSTAVQENSAGIGPGVNLSRWFREDPEHAPRSYFELSLQYRFRLVGAQRAKGVFLTLTMTY